MARYRKVDSRIWNDAKFSSLSDNGKLAFLMLLTHPSMTSIGAMRATIPGLASEMNWTTEDFREAFMEASSKGMAEHDGKACLIALPNFIRYNQPESPNVVKAWVGALDLLPECGLKNLVISRARDFAEGMSKAFAEALPEDFAKNMPYPEPEPEPEQEKETRSNTLERQAARKTATRFLEFWAAYPVKKGKAEAEKQWAAKHYDQIADRIIEDVRRRIAEDRQWIEGYAPHGSTYVNARTWEDDIEPVRGASATSTRRDADGRPRLVM